MFKKIDVKLHIYDQKFNFWHKNPTTIAEIPPPKTHRVFSSPPALKNEPPKRHPRSFLGGPHKPHPPAGDNYTQGISKFTFLCDPD